MQMQRLQQGQCCQWECGLTRPTQRGLDDVCVVEAFAGLQINASVEQVVEIKVGTRHKDRLDGAVGAGTSEG